MRNKDTKIQDAINHINEIATTEVRSSLVTAAKGKVKIGEYIMDTFFEGDIEKASSKNAHKESSYGDLLKRKDDLPFSKPVLAQMVRVAWVHRFLKENLKKEEVFDIFTYTHLIHFTRLQKDPELFKEVAEKCLEEKWNTTKLSKEISKKLNKGSASPEKPIILRIRLNKENLESLDETQLKEAKKAAKKAEKELKAFLQEIENKITSIKDGNKTPEESEEPEGSVNEEEVQDTEKGTEEQESDMQDTETDGVEAVGTEEEAA